MKRAYFAGGQENVASGQENVASEQEKRAYRQFILLSYQREFEREQEKAGRERQNGAPSPAAANSILP